MTRVHRCLATGLAMLALSLSGPARADICPNQQFFEQCPTADPAFSKFIGDFKIRKDGVLINPATLTCTAPVSAMPIAQWTDELVLLQSLRAIYYMDLGRSGHLPWTPGTLYDWLKAGVGGINISTTAANDQYVGQIYVAQGDTANYFVMRAKPDTTRAFQKKWEGIALLISLIAHERRHGDGAAYNHVRCCPAQDPANPNSACDQTYSENASMSPYAIQYWLEKQWVNGYINVSMGCLPPADLTEAVALMRSDANAHVAPSNFCTSTPPALNDANDPVAPCAGTCPAPVAECPAHIYLANNTVAPNGMKGNGGFLTYDLSATLPKGAGKQCTYKRPDTANYDPFIGRNLNPGEIKAVSAGPNRWKVFLKKVGIKFVICPATLPIGPVAMYSGPGGSMPNIPPGWLVTAGNTQTLTFDMKSAQLPFALRCNYHGVSDVVMNVN